MHDWSHHNASPEQGESSDRESRAATPGRLLDCLAAITRNRVLLVVCGLLALGCVREAGLDGLDWGWTSFWNDVRLSRAYAAVGGADLYGSEDEGVLAGHLYGPVGFFLYAPARLAERPDHGQASFPASGVPRSPSP